MHATYELLEQEVTHFLKEQYLVEKQTRHEAVSIYMCQKVDKYEDERNKEELNKEIKNRETMKKSQ